LAKVDGGSKVEIKCPRCKTMNLYTKEIYITIEENVTIEENEKDPCTDPEIAES
jgi:phage FluMu protein Com